MAGLQPRLRRRHASSLDAPVPRFRRCARGCARPGRSRARREDPRRPRAAVRRVARVSAAEDDERRPRLLARRDAHAATRAQSMADPSGVVRSHRLVDRGESRLPRRAGRDERPGVRPPCDASLVAQPVLLHHCLRCRIGHAASRRLARLRRARAVAVPLSAVRAGRGRDPSQARCGPPALEPGQNQSHRRRQGSLDHRHLEQETGKPGPGGARTARGRIPSGPVTDRGQGAGGRRRVHDVDGGQTQNHERPFGHRRRAIQLVSEERSPLALHVAAAPSDDGARAAPDTRDAAASSSTAIESCRRSPCPRPARSSKRATTQPSTTT